MEPRAWTRGRDWPSPRPAGDACPPCKAQQGPSPPKGTTAAMLCSSHGGVHRGQTACLFVTRDVQPSSQNSMCGKKPSCACPDTTAHHYFGDFPLPKTQRKPSHFSAGCCLVFPSSSSTAEEKYSFSNYFNLILISRSGLSIYFQLAWVSLSDRDRIACQPHC